LIVVEDGEVKRGWETVREAANQVMGAEGMVRISAGVVDVVSLSPGIAIAVVPYAITINTNTGPQQLRGTMSLVLKKSSGTWKTVHDHSSTVAQES
jgi:ketosteroid isomerase-like protein